MKDLIKNKEILSKVMTYTITGFLLLIGYFVLDNFGKIVSYIKGFIDILAPFIWGIGLAFVLLNYDNLIFRILPKKLGYKARKVIASVVSVLTAIIVFTLLVLIVAPYIVDSVKQITRNVYSFTASAPTWISNIEIQFGLSNEVVVKIYDYISSAVDILWKNITNVIPSLINVTINTFSSLFNFLIGFLVAIYFLIEKDNLMYTFRKLFKVILSEKNYQRGSRVAKLMKTKMYKAITGKLLDSFIIGVICFIAMICLRIDYSVLISLIVFVTNVVPYFGPFIGGAIGALILLIFSPRKAFIFIIMVFILQQLDGNVIGPAILGDSVGLSALWIMFAVIVANAYFGLTGMLLGVPVFAVIYYLVKDYIDEKIKSQNIKVE